MGFASTYLENRTIFPKFIHEAPDRQTGIIVVVPVYNEPAIESMLRSLALCQEPECKVEVIVVVNAPLDVSEEISDNNISTMKNIESWKKANIGCFFRLFAFNTDNHSIANWGVGLARKTGMDEAVRRFDYLNNPDGIILNLDADCLVEKNYFVSVYAAFLKNKDRSACSIYFEHPLSGTEFHESVYSSIVLYELHLRYYFQSLAYCGFPYVYHTVGSAIAVRAISYVKAGGMNRKQAGEDFYFIQKLLPAGGYFSLNRTTVYPSPRASERVPFGTGATIGKLTEDKLSTLLTYNLLAFKELRILFKLSDSLFQSRIDDLKKYYDLFPEGLKSFIDVKEWSEKIEEIKKNTSGQESFKKRFFGWFNMFKIVKYLNFVHAGIFEKIPVDIAAIELLDNLGIVINSREPDDLLQKYRLMEKNS